MVYVEFGAGRGYLSYMIWECYKGQNFVMVERRGYKFKAERTMRKEEKVNIERLRIDIGDLKLSGVEKFRGFPFVGMGKHLCGAATDLSLRCCFSPSHPTNEKSTAGVTATSPPTGIKTNDLLKGLAIATCCHHLCDWRSYINKHFFRELGFSSSEFRILTWFTSWAIPQNLEHLVDDADEKEIDGSDEKESYEKTVEKKVRGKGREKGREMGGEEGQTKKGTRKGEGRKRGRELDEKREENNNVTIIEIKDLLPVKHPIKSLRGTKDDSTLDPIPVLEEICEGRITDFSPLTALNASEKKILGHKCKRLIDTGRLEWIIGAGLECQLVEYIGKEISPENKLLLAWRK